MLLKSAHRWAPPVRKGAGRGRAARRDDGAGAQGVGGGDVRHVQERLRLLERQPVLWAHADGLRALPAREAGGQFRRQLPVVRRRDREGADGRLNRRFAAGLNSVPKVTQRLLRTMFVGLDQVVPAGVGFVIDLLPRRVGVEPGHGLADALRERYGRAVARNETLDLGIIEDHADGFVAQEAAARLGNTRRDEVAGYMHQARLDAGCLGRQAIPLVPAHHLVAGDVEGVPDGLLARQQSHQSFGEIGVVGDDPERRAIPGNNHFLSAAHAIHCGVGLGPTVDREGDLRVAIGQRRAHDGDGEALFAVRAHKALFAGDLLLRVHPVRVGERCGLGDQIVRRGLLVCAGGTDEDVVAGPATEQRYVALYVRWFKGDPIDYGVERGAGECVGHGWGVLDVNGQRIYAGWRTG